MSVATRLPPKYRSTQDADTASRKRTRAQQSQEERDDGRHQDREARRRKRSVDDTRDSVFNDNCFHILNPPDENFKKSLVMKAIKQVICTKRPNGTHQATVCVVCDRVIIGEEKVCNISTERLEENRHRISVVAYEEFYRKPLHPLLVEQYSVEGQNKYSPTRQTQSSGQSKKGQLFIVTLDIVEGNFGLLKVETKTGIGMYLFDKKDLEKYEKIPGFLQIVDLHNKDGSEDEEDAVEKDVEDSGAGDTKKSYEDRMEEKGEIAAIIQQIAKPFPAATDEIVAQMYNEHFEQETFKSDVAKAVINT
eukprot:scaffold26240_cov180-Skeletonema_marinoi.AAC.1